MQSDNSSEFIRHTSVILAMGSAQGEINSTTVYSSPPSLPPPQSMRHNRHNIHCGVHLLNYNG